MYWTRFTTKLVVVNEAKAHAARAAPEQQRRTVRGRTYGHAPHPGGPAAAQHRSLGDPAQGRGRRRRARRPDLA